MEVGHVHTNEDVIEKSLHFSHLFRYVSAYELSDKMCSNLWEDLLDGLRRSKETRESVIVGQDGEHFFVCNPSGSFDLCTRWKSYRVCDNKNA